jgi:hypothetical protein
MYFVLPECIPPRPLGEAGVRKQWSTEYTDLITVDTVWYITTDTLIQTFYPPLPPTWGRASIIMYYIILY